MSNRRSEIKISFKRNLHLLYCVSFAQSKFLALAQYVVFSLHHFCIAFQYVLWENTTVNKYSTTQVSNRRSETKLVFLSNWRLHYCVPFKHSKFSKRHAFLQFLNNLNVITFYIRRYRQMVNIQLLKCHIDDLK